MADGSSTNLSLVLPEVGASTDTWGAKLNTNFTDLDAIFGSGGTAVAMGDISPDSIATPLVVSSTGPHAIGGTTSAVTRLRLGGNFTSDGSSTEAFGFGISDALTGAAGDTTKLVGALFTTNITTQTATENIADIAQVLIDEPDITDNLTGDITNASSLKITGAPTEGTNNYALWVDAGAVQFDGTLDVDGVLTAGVGITVSGGTAGAGKVVKDGTNGLVVGGASGTSYDFAVDDPSQTQVIRVPTGTQNVEMPNGSLAWGGGSAIASSDDILSGTTLTASDTSPTPSSVSGDSFEEYDIAVAGAAIGDTVVASVNGETTQGDAPTASNAYVDTAGTVTVTVYNASAGALSLDRIDVAVLQL